MTNPKELDKNIQAQLEERKKGQIYTPEQKLAIIDALDDYVESCTTMPNLYEFAADNKVLTGTIRAWPEAVDAIKHLNDTQAKYILSRLGTDKQPIRWIFLAKSLIGLYDTPQPQDTQQDSMTITLTGQPSGKLVDAMTKFTQRNKQMNG